MTKEKRASKLFGLLAALLLLALFAGPACAASITIQGNGQTQGEDTRFSAYQIFKGTYGGEANSLGNVQWGSGVKDGAEGIMNQLKASSYPVDGENNTFGTKFTEAYTQDLEDPNQQASFVARFLEKNKETPGYANAFARTMAENLSEQKTDSSKSGADWKIDSLDDGYYLVKDNYAEKGDTPDGSVSTYILKVAGDETVTLKATVPTVTLTLQGKSSAVAETGEELTFVATGTVAQNVDEYSKYPYKFTFTIPKGLTVTGGAEDPNVTVTIGQKQFTETEHYTVTLTEQDGQENTLTVEFDDLIAKAKLADAENGLKDSSSIVVTFHATLNKHAEIGTTGNKCSVVLNYANDPYNDGNKGDTAAVEATVYTTGVKATVKGPQSKEQEDLTELNGAKFKLKKGSQYAVLEQQDGVWAITGWENDISRATEMESTGSGEFQFKGLKGGDYSLVQTEATEKYEKMSDVNFTITAEGDDLTSATLAAKDSPREDFTVDQNNLQSQGGITLTNYLAPDLPFTGFMGEYAMPLFVALIAIGIAAIVVSKRSRA